MMKKHDHHLFLNWLILTGVIITSVVIVWHQGFFYTLFASDKSKISIAICLIYTLGSLHCAIRAWQISSQLSIADKTTSLIKRHQHASVHLDRTRLRLGEQTSIPTSFMSEFLIDTVTATTASNEHKEDNARSTALAEIYSDKLKSSHEYGWFFVDAMIKLGLLGTIVGFILMLSSVADTANLDLNAMQKVMQQMSSGMGTALYTTLTGVTGSLLLAMQYQMLDRGADDLMHTAIHTAEVHILPNFVPQT